MTQQSTNALIDRLYDAEEADKLKVEIEDAPTHIATVEDNASLPRKKGGEEDTAEYMGEIYIMVSVNYEASPIPEPDEYGSARSITAQRTRDGSFARPTFDIPTPASTPPGDNQKWIDDPHDIERVDTIK